MAVPSDCSSSYSRWPSWLPWWPQRIWKMGPTAPPLFVWSSKTHHHVERPSLFNTSEQMSDVKRTRLIRFWWQMITNWIGWIRALFSQSCCVKKALWSNLSFSRRVVPVQVVCTADYKLLVPSGVVLIYRICMEYRCLHCFCFVIFTDIIK